MQHQAKSEFFKNVCGEERGFILIVTMLILVVLTIVGIAALDSSTFEVRIAANDRWSRVAFNLADGGVYSTSKLASEAIDSGVDPTYTPVSFVGFTTNEDGTAVPHAAQDFYKRVMGYMETQTDDTSIDPALPDFQIKPRGGSEPETVEVYMVAREGSMVAGGGAEFGAGAAGAGVGSGGGGAAVTFDFDVESFAGNNSHSTVSARYRKVLGTTGGL